jgi:hypothetical protein
VGGSGEHVCWANVPITPAQVHFEQTGPRLTAVKIVRGGRSPVIGALHRVLVTLGIVVASYQARASDAELTERIVIERGDGGSIEAELSEETKAAILRIAVE